MPFVQVSRRMAEARAGRRRSRQQYEIESLTQGFESARSGAQGRFQQEQSQIQNQYQQQLADYASRMGDFEAAARQFQERSQEYNTAVDRFNQVNTLPGGFVALPRRDRPSTFLTADPNADFNLYNVDTPTGRALAGVPGTKIDTWYVDNKRRVGGFDAANLPSNLVLNRVGTSRGGSPTYSLAQRVGPDPGEFSAQAPQAPESAPDAPSFEGLSERYRQSLEEQRVFTEREIGERRAATRRARTRMRDRPLMTGA